MRERKTTEKEQAKFTGKRHSVTLQYTNKDAKERLHAFLKKYGNDLNPHECAVDYYAENPDFSVGFQAYANIHVLEDIIKNMMKVRRPEESENFKLPIDVEELGGLPLFVPYISEIGQLRFRAVADAEWFHLESWRSMDNKSLTTASKKNHKVNRVVGFFEPLMKGTKLTVRLTCELLVKDPQ